MCQLCQIPNFCDRFVEMVRDNIRMNRGARLSESTIYVRECRPISSARAVKFICVSVIAVSCCRQEVYRVSLDQGAYGGDSVKPTDVYSNTDAIASLHRQWSRGSFSGSFSWSRRCAVADPRAIHAQLHISVHSEHEAGDHGAAPQTHRHGETLPGPASTSASCD